jgi:acetylornithine/succinyldiaminopimelate/putrescine aminotransferase
VGVIALEPIQSMAGVRVPSPGFLEGLRALADQHGARLMFDEVQTGSGRTGTPFAATTYGVTPDLITTAKGAAGGLPIGITVVRSSVAEGLPGSLLGSTFGGGPTILSAAVEVATRVASPGFLESVRASGEALAKAAARGPVREVRGAGLLLGIVLEEGLTAREARDQLLAQDVLVGTSDDPNVLRLFPALALTIEQAERFGEAFATLRASV